MTGFAPAANIAGPPRLPFPFGLFSVVSLAESATERWENGVTWEALTCDPVAIVVGDCDSPTGFPKDFPDTGPGIGEASAFTVYGTYLCSPIGQSDPFTHAQTQAKAVLRAREEAAVEGRVWYQIASNNPTVLTVTDYVDTLGLLENWIADNYGSLGVIHASRNAAITLAQGGLISAKGNQMLTAIGTPVVVGAGYPGTGLTSKEGQTITKSGTVTSGNFKLTYRGQTTANIAYDASAVVIKNRLEALSNITAVTTSGGPVNTTPVVVTFDDLPYEDQPMMTVDASGLVGGGTFLVTESTPGGVGASPAAGTEFVAATPAMFGYRSQVFEATNRSGDLLNRGTNDLYGIAERNYLIGMEPCGAAIAALPLGCCS